jgi:hypothetical protein
VAVGDLNLDGKPDLAVGNSNSNNVSLFLGNGLGGFSSGGAFVMGQDPRSVVIGDFDGDARPDVVTANYLANTVSVRLGNGTGGLGAKTDYGTGGHPASIVAGDLNGDVGLDLVTTDYFSSAVTVLLNARPGLPTPTTLAAVTAAFRAGRVELVWYGASMTGVLATVYRRTEQADWTEVARIAGDGTGTLRFADANVLPGGRYDYRLGVRRGGAEEYLGETSVVVPMLSLALEGLRPNPAAGDLMAAFTLSNGTPAKLELLDVTGRLWLTRAVGDLGAGSHTLRLEKRVPAGIYWLRLTQGSSSVLARGVVMQ